MILVRQDKRCSCLVASKCKVAVVGIHIGKGLIHAKVVDCEPYDLPFVSIQVYTCEIQLIVIACLYRIGAASITVHKDVEAAHYLLIHS